MRLLLKYDTNEVLRYLGYRGKPADDRTLKMIDEVYGELCKVITPKYIYKEYEYEKTVDSIIVNGIEFKSKKLLSHLKNSDTVALFGATLGTGADTLIRKYSFTDTPRAAIGQATAASLVENLCDLGCEEIKTTLGCELRPRFSPGYSDLSLSCQADFFKLLDMSKRLGVTLADSYLMTPSKSVTAFVGIIKKDGELNELY